MRTEEAREFAPLAIALKRRTCPICSSRLILTGIEFSLSDVDLQTFRCARCAHVERVVVPVAGESDGKQFYRAETPTNLPVVSVKMS
jgi:hypothetical protein